MWILQIFSSSSAIVGESTSKRQDCSNTNATSVARNLSLSVLTALIKPSARLVWSLTLYSSMALSRKYPPSRWDLFIVHLTLFLLKLINIYSWIAYVFYSYSRKTPLIVSLALPILQSKLAAISLRLMLMYPPTLVTSNMLTPFWLEASRSISP